MQREGSVERRPHWVLSTPCSHLRGWGWVQGKRAYVTRPTGGGQSRREELTWWDARP